MSDTVHMIAPDSTSWDVPAEKVAQAESTGWHQANAAPVGSQGPGPGADILPWLLGAGALAAGDRLLPLAGQGAANVPQAAKTLMGMAHPVAGKVLDFLSSFQPATSAPVSPPAGPAASPASGEPIPFLNPPTGKPQPLAATVKLTPHDVETFPEFSRLPVGKEISRKAYEKIVLTPAASSPAEKAMAPQPDIAPKANPRAPGPTIQNDQIVPAPPPGYTEAGNKQPTLSGPATARRAAARKAAAAKVAAAEPVAPEPDMADQLRTSVAANEAHGVPVPSRGGPQGWDAGMRGKMGLVGPPLVEAIMYLLGAAHTSEDMQAAHEAYLKSLYPQESTRRALTGPTGS